MLITGAICFHNALICMTFVPASKIMSHPLNFWTDDNIRLNNNNNSVTVDERYISNEKLAEAESMLEIKAGNIS